MACARTTLENYQGDETPKNKKAYLSLKLETISYYSQSIKRIQLRVRDIDL